MEPTTPRDAVRKWDTWEILAAPYLDTEHDAPWSSAFAEELRIRRIVGMRGFAYKLVALGGFWWNFAIWWEWIHLDKKHLVWGWILNGVLVVSVIIGAFVHWAAGIGAFFALQWAVWPYVRRRMEK